MAELKKNDLLFIKGEDLKEYQDTVLESLAWTETLKQAFIISAEKRQKMKKKVFLYWTRMILKYHLDKAKTYNLNPDTGEVTLKEKKNE